MTMSSSLTFRHPATAATTNDLLWFEGGQTGTWAFRIGGFTTDTIKVMDVVSPDTLVDHHGGAAEFDGLTYTQPFSQVIAAEQRCSSCVCAVAVTHFTRNPV